MVNMSTITLQFLGSKKNDSSIDWVRIQLRNKTGMTQKDSGSKTIYILWLD